MSKNKSNAPRHIAELKALRQEYVGSTNFDFLGPKVPEATETNPTRMKIIFPDGEHPLSIIVTMPHDYPSDSPPIFKVNNKVESSSGPLSASQLEAIEDILKESASYMSGQSCISVVLMSLDGLDINTLDLGTPGRCRSIIKVEVVNNSKFFVNAIKGAANGLPCRYYYRIITVLNNPKFSAAVDPWRAVHVILDAPSKKEAVSFMKTVRTDGAMDWDMLGKPGKIQLTVMEEFEMAPRALSIEDPVFSGVAYNADPELEELMSPYLAKNAQVKV